MWMTNEKYNADGTITNEPLIDFTLGDLEEFVISEEGFDDKKRSFEFSILQECLIIKA